MKKIIFLGLFSLLVFSGCFQKVEITSREEKLRIVKEALSNNLEAKEELEKIISNLEELKGNERAQKELNEWKEIYRKEKTSLMFQVSEKTRKSVEEMRRTGKIW